MNFVGGSTARDVLRTSISNQQQSKSLSTLAPCAHRLTNQCIVATVQESQSAEDAITIKPIHLLYIHMMTAEPRLLTFDPKKQSLKQNLHGGGFTA